MKQIRTQAGIVGAGPAGLLLGHLPHLAGVDSVAIGNRSRQYVIERVRAGVLEQGTVDLMVESGLSERLLREGMRHDGIYLSFGGTRQRIDRAELTGGRAITVYGQNEVVSEMIYARIAVARPLYFEVGEVSVQGFDTSSPTIRFRHGEEPHEIQGDFIAGCDGFHGICRQSIPAAALRVCERVYPFGWLGILARAAPSRDELVYSLHERGFALFSMRSPSVTRRYLQCATDEDIGQWPDDRIWDELNVRLSTSDGWKPNRGEIFQKGDTEMRSFVAEPMWSGRLFLAGDAAHIVPAAGAQGLNLAASDVGNLSITLTAFYRSGTEQLLSEYSDKCLRRIWKAQRCSWWMTSMLHLSPDGNEFDYRRLPAEPDYVISSRAAMATLADNYTGLPVN